MSPEPTNSMNACDVLVGLITAPRTEADRIAEDLVRSGLAACCNIVPTVTSYFNWQGKVKKETEALIVLKTTRARSRDLVARVEEIHTYDVPEMLLLEVTEGLEGYLKWVTEECSR